MTQQGQRARGSSGIARTVRDVGTTGSVASRRSESRTRSTGVRFLHTSDWHLGMTRHFLEGEAQARYTAARIDAIREIGRVADAEDCAFVVVAGDVFDSNLCTGQAVRRALDAMATINCPVFLLPGNHDALNAATIYRNRDFQQAKPEHVHVLDRPGPFQAAPGVEIHAAPLLTNRPLMDVVGDAVRDLSPGNNRRVLVGHGVVDTFAPGEGDVAMVRTAPLEEAIRAGVVDYVALGDRHSRAAVGTTGRIHYSGSPEVTAFVDGAAGDVLVVELGDEVTVTPRRVGTWRFVDVDRHVDTADDIADLDRELRGLDPKDRVVVRTALTGTLTLTLRAELEAVLELHRQVLAGLFAWDRHTDLAVVVDPDELTDLGIGGYVDAAVTDLAQRAAGDGDDSQTARDALSLLYRLAAGGAR